MESKLKIDTENIMEIVNDMIQAKFNDHNPLINDIRNHVVIESSIDREIPQVKDKVELIAAQQAAIMGEPIMNEMFVDKSEYQSEDEQSEIKQINNISNTINSINTINIAKLSIIILIIIIACCYLVYIYVDIDNKYKYAIMSCICIIGVLCCYYISKKFNWL